MGTAASCTSHGNAVAPHDQYRATEIGDHTVVTPAGDEDTTHARSPTSNKRPILPPLFVAFSLTAVKVCIETLLCAIFGMDVPAGRSTSHLFAVLEQGIGLVLDADNGVMSWKCFALDDITALSKPCKAELRFGGGDGAMHAYCLLQPVGVCVCCHTLWT